MGITSVAVLDNGLRSKFGHSYSINKAVSRRFHQLGISHQIFSAQSVEADVRAEMECVPFFTRGMYDGIRPSRIERSLRRFKRKAAGMPNDRSPSESRTSRVLNAGFEADLGRLPRSVWGRDKIVLFPGLMQHQMLGMARFIRSHREEISANIICHLMFEPSWLPWGGSSALGEKTYENSFQIIEAQRRRVHFTTENENVVRKYAKEFGIRMDILPIPLSVGRAARCQARRIRIGFLGYSKMEKGFHLLPDAIATCLNGPLELDFVVQINHHGSQQMVSEAETALNKLPIRILRGQLSQEQYRSELAEIDVILLPYDPHNFGLRGSGVFTEAVSCGHLVVASKGTWAGQSIENGEAIGETFEPYDAQALAAAILRVGNDFRARQDEARKVAQAWASRNSAEEYVDKLLALAVERSPTSEFVQRKFLDRWKSKCHR
jgi:glycosyltransferase involved in cell wall biosynthesis